MLKTHHSAKYVGTAAERTALTLPTNAQGTLFWDTDIGSYYAWDGTQWVIAGGGYPFNVITVDLINSAADYDDIVDAITDAPAGSTILAGPGTFPMSAGSFIGKNLTIIGLGKDVTYFDFSGINLFPLASSASYFILQDFTMINNSFSAADNMQAIATFADKSLFVNIRVEASVNADNVQLAAYGLYKGNMRLINCDCDIDGNSQTGSSLTGIHTQGASPGLHSLRIEEGYYKILNGVTASKAIASTLWVPIELINPFLEGDLSDAWPLTGIENANDIIRGAFRTPKGQINLSSAIQTMAMNESGGAVTAGMVGYLDKLGEFKTTTTPGDPRMAANPAVVVEDAGDGVAVPVVTDGFARVQYSSAPADGQYVRNSSTAGQVEGTSVYSSGAFGKAQHAGAFGSVGIVIIKKRHPLDVVNVDLNNPNADYTDLATAFSEIGAQIVTIRVGPGTHVCDNLTLPDGCSLIGSGIGTTALIGTNGNGLTATNASISNMRIAASSIITSGNALVLSGSNVLKAIYVQGLGVSSATIHGISLGGTQTFMYDCRVEASNDAHGITETAATSLHVFGGMIQGTSIGFDLDNNGGAWHLHNLPVLYRGRVSISGGTIVGPWIDLTTGKIVADYDGIVRPSFNISARSTEPSGPATGDIYLDDGTNSAGGTPTFRMWNGSEWVDLGGAGLAQEYLDWVRW